MPPAYDLIIERGGSIVVETIEAPRSMIRSQAGGIGALQCLPIQQVWHVRHIPQLREFNGRRT